jgi:outer membrane protein OmpA-like peptidoglycan-associated protein
MPKALLSVVTIVFTLTGLSQRQLPRPMSAGDLVNQTLKLFDSTNSAVSLEVPGKEAMLFYRYRGYNWFTDNADSVEVAEKLIQNILKEAPTLKKLRVICYSYNLDNFLTNKPRPFFKPDSNYTVEYYFLNNRSASTIINNGKLSLFTKDGLVLATSHYLGNFKFVYKPSAAKVLKAKLLTVKNGTKLPLSNTRVYFFSDKKDTLSITTTNEYGDFELKAPEESTDAMLTVAPVQKNVRTVILATQQGREITTFQKTAEGFQYKFIHADIFRLTEMQEDEDISLMVKDFASKNEKEFKRTEDITYDMSRYELGETSKQKLDKLGRTLMENQSIRLEVISHTDSQGDDAANMQLSEKRSGAVVAYLIFIGVNKTRLKGVGKGETEIRNRCKNHVSCSDMEHSYNRRTEFRFYKD